MLMTAFSQCHYIILPCTWTADNSAATAGVFQIGCGETVILWIYPSLESAYGTVFLLRIQYLSITF